MVTIASHRRRPAKRGSLDLVSVAVLFVALVAVALVLVGVATLGTSPIALVLPTLLGFWAITSIRSR